MKKLFAIITLLALLFVTATTVEANDEEALAWQYYESLLAKAKPSFAAKHETITRAQAAYMLAQLQPNAPLYTKNYKDVPATHPYYKEIMQVTALGVFAGYPDNTFKPDAGLTRAQLAKILTEFFHLNTSIPSPIFTDISPTSWSYEYIQKLYALNITKGTTAKTFTPNRFATQRHFGLFLYRVHHLAPSTLAVKTPTLASAGGYGFKDGSLQTAMLRAPQSMTKRGTEWIVTDTDNHLLRTFTLQGISTYAGNSYFYEGSLPLSFLKNGSLSEAMFNQPTAIVTLKDGSLLVADSGNHLIRKVSPAGQVTTFAGTGQAGLKDGTAAQAMFNSPQGLAVAADGTVYVADTLNHVIRQISPKGVVSTLTNKQLRTVQITKDYKDTAGSYADGPLASAKFNEPTTLLLDSKGNLYVSDSGNHVIRYIHLNTNSVSTFAGQFEDNGLYGQGGYVDGRATTAKFNYPRGLALLPNGELVVADSTNHALRLVTNNRVTTFSTAQSQPAGLAVDGQTLFVVNSGSGQIQRFTIPAK